jgi:hypothetical protein
MLRRPVQRAFTLLVFALCLARGSAQAQSWHLPPTLQVPRIEQAAPPPEPSRESRELRRANLLLQLGVPTLVIGATNLAFWTALGRPNEGGNAGYGCGGWYTPAIVAPITALGLAATVHGAIHRRRLRRAGVESAPFNKPLRVLGVVAWSAAFGLGASFVAATESICNT